MVANSFDLGLHTYIDVAHCNGILGSYHNNPNKPLRVYSIQADFIVITRQISLRRPRIEMDGAHTLKEEDSAFATGCDLYTAEVLTSIDDPIREKINPYLV